MGNGRPFPRDETARVKNEWSCTSTPPCTFMARTGARFTVHELYAIFAKSVYLNKT